MLASAVLHLLHAAASAAAAAPLHTQLYLAQYEHLPLQLSRSSCQPLGLRELLALADEQLAAQWRDLQLGYPPNAGSLQYREVRCVWAGSSFACKQRALFVCVWCVCVPCLQKVPLLSAWLGDDSGTQGCCCCCNAAAVAHRRWRRTTLARAQMTCCRACPTKGSTSRWRRCWGLETLWWSCSPVRAAADSRAAASRCISQSRVFSAVLAYDCMRAVHACV